MACKGFFSRSDMIGHQPIYLYMKPNLANLAGSDEHAEREDLQLMWYQVDRQGHHLLPLPQLWA
jgi:hypothetical protein